MRLLKHLINKLPEDTISRMMLQQSKKALNTVSHAHLYPVERG